MLTTPLGSWMIIPLEPREIMAPSVKVAGAPETDKVWVPTTTAPPDRVETGNPSMLPAKVDDEDPCTTPVEDPPDWLEVVDALVGGCEDAEADADGEIVEAGTTEELEPAEGVPIEPVAIGRERVLTIPCFRVISPKFSSDFG